MRRGADWRAGTQSWGQNSVTSWVASGRGWRGHLEQEDGAVGRSQMDVSLRGQQWTWICLATCDFMHICDFMQEHVFRAARGGARSVHSCAIPSGCPYPPPQ